MYCLRFVPSVLLALLAAITILCPAATPVAHAQATLTWDATGVSQSIGDGGNWVGGVAPNFLNTNASDSLVFSASTNTTVVLRDVQTGDTVGGVLFDATAPAYTFLASPGNTVNDLSIRASRTMTNLSNNTQTFHLPDVFLAASATTKLVATSGDPTTRLSYDMDLLWFSSGASVTGDFDTRTAELNGTNPSSTLTKGPGLGTLFVIGDSTITPDPTNLPVPGKGILAIGSATATTLGPFGAVRISNDKALGIAGDTSTNYTLINGGVNVDGRLELTGNINSAERIVLAGRADGSATSGGTTPYNNILNVAISNVSGNNTLSGTIAPQGGGGGYNFGSTSGTLTVTGDITWGATFDRYLTFQGAGDGLFSGSLIGGTGSNVGVPVIKYGAGTLTLGGAANTSVSNMIVHGGTLAFGATSGFTFASTSDTTLAPRVLVDSGAKLDVSAISGGFTLTQSLQGSGTVAGSLAMANGTQILPGGAAVTSADGLLLTGFSSSVGQLTFQNGLNLSAGAQMVWKLGALSTASPGTNFDQLVVNGSLALGGSSSLSVDLSLLSGAQAPGGGDPFWNTSHTWTIINSPINPGNTNFASLVGGTVATGTFSAAYSAPVAGDVDHNGVVNGLDISLIAANWLRTGAPGIPGDADFNGVVNGLDISLIAGNWLQSGGLGGVVLTYTPSGPGAAVPEPSTFLLAAVGLVGLICVRKQRR